jgi:hypothetical protein
MADDAIDPPRAVRYARANERSMKRIDGAVLLLVSLLAATAAAAAVRARAFAGGTPPWDEASHGLQGYAIAQDVARLDVPNFLADVVGTRYRYPFGHPFLLVPAYLFFGPTWLMAVGVSALLYAALVVALFAAGRGLASRPDAAGGAAPLLAAAAAAALALTSPAVLAQATTIMLELPAALCGVLVLWLYGRALDAPESEGRQRALGWTLTAFALTAAQYATVWLLVVALDEAWRCRPEERRAARAWAAGVLRSRALWCPVHIAVALLLALAALIMATGGWEFRLGGRMVSMTRPSNAVTFALFLVGARVAWLSWRHRVRLRVAIPARHRILFMSVVVPLFLWYFVLYPGRFSHYLNWVMGSPPSIARASLAYWTFYPQFVVEQGHLGPAVATAVLAAIALGVLRRGVPEKVRFLRWAAVATGVFVIVHPARQERFILPFLPVWWLLAAETVAAGWAWIRRPALRWGLGLAAAAALAAALGPPAASLYTRRLPGLAAGTFTPAALGYRDVVPYVAEQVQNARSVRILGTCAGLSDYLFEWELRTRVDLRGRTLKSELDNPVKAGLGTDPAGPRTVFDRWLAKAPEAVVAALEPIDLMERPEKPLDGLWAHDLEWTYRSMRLLRGTDRYALAAERAFPAARLRVRVYAIKGG